MLRMDRAEAMLARLPIRDRYSRRIIPFRLKWAQHQMMELAKKQQREGRPIRIIILKARRVGGSSWTEGIGTLHSIESESALGLIVAHQFKSSKGLFEVPINLIDRSLPGRQPLAKLCGITHTKHEIIIPHKTNDTTISLATAGSVSGAGGRGLSFTFLHLSEAAYFPGVQPFTSLLPTVPYDPNTIVVIESTANGRVGPGASFYDYWQKACEGRNDYAPVFVPWHKDPSYIRHSDTGGPPYDEYEEWLVKEFGCTEQQIAWWRSTLETECKGVLSTMQQEYPASAEEAFVITGDPTFQVGELEYVRSTLTEPLEVGDILCSDPRGAAHFERYGTGDWCIWKHPVPGHKYFMGYDSARGLQIEEGEVEPVAEGDFAAQVIWDADTNEMVARYAKRDNPEVAARKANAAGRYYNKAMIAVEITGGYGAWAQRVLREPPYSYPNLYRWKGGRDDKVGESNKLYRKPALGWDTTGNSRQLLVDAFRSAIRQKVTTIYDSVLLIQMENAQNKEGFRWEVVRGHDDIFMAAMIGWIAREQWGRPWGAITAQAGGVAPQNPEEHTDKSISYQEGPMIVDGAALTISNHFHKIMGMIRKSNRPNPLIGI